MISKIKQEYYDTKKLLRNTPPMVMTILCISIILMNLFKYKLFSIRLRISPFLDKFSLYGYAYKKIWSKSSN